MGSTRCLVHRMPWVKTFKVNRPSRYSFSIWGWKQWKINSHPSLVLTGWRRRWKVILVWFTGSRGAWNSFLNEVWEFFVDFNYPSYRWTSLAHVIGNWLCIIRTTGVSSSEAVTLVLLTLCPLMNIPVVTPQIQPQKPGRKNQNSSITIFSVGVYMGDFVSHHIFVTYE